MRAKSWAIVAIGLALVACSQDGSPTGPEPQVLQPTGHAPPVASASGGANWVLEVFGFTIPQVLGFSATKFADGSVTGHINYHQTFLGETLKFSAIVTCMNVYDGNRVKYGGEVTRSTDPTVPVGTFMWFHSIDNGEGKGSPPDQTTGSGFGTEEDNEAFCNSSALPNPIFLADIESGNIRVRG